MKRSQILSYVCLGVLVGLVLPFDVFAAKEFGAAELETWGATVKSLLFGPFIKIAAFCGAAYGLFQCFYHHTVVPLLIFSSVALIGVVAPTFIEKVYGVSSMLLP